MGRSAVLITPEMFAAWKERHKVRWELVLPVKQEGARGKKRILVRCICKREVMALAQQIQKGRSTACTSCAKIGMDLQEMNEYLKSIGSLWQVEELRRYSKTTGELQIWSTCTGCNRKKFNTWAVMSTGKSHGCSFCRCRFVKIGRVNPFTEFEKAVRTIWTRIIREARKKDLENVFSDFNELKKWCSVKGFEDGDRIFRHNKQIGWTYENCFVVKTQQGVELRNRKTSERLRSVVPNYAKPLSVRGL